MPTTVLSGIGYDVHALTHGRPLILGGVEIPHAQGLEGHSDADVLIHAIADALLGTIAAGDIGHHFPNTDESIRGIRSTEILVAGRGPARRARRAHHQRRCDAHRRSAPRIAPHVDTMRRRLAECLRLPLSRVSVKATTNEKLGFLGRAEGIAAMAIASVERDEAEIDPETAPPLPVTRRRKFCREKARKKEDDGNGGSVPFVTAKE